MNRLSTFCVFLIVFACQARGQEPGEMFAGYDSFCGLPVVVGYDPQVASARMDSSGHPIIHVDPGAMSNWTVSRIFTLAHECGHHQLGHTSAMGAMQRYYGGTARQELEADCWAAQKLKSLGLFSDITRTVLQQASQGHFSSQGYPSGIERASNISACVGGGGGQQCRTITRPCNHPAHPNGDQVLCSHLVLAHPLGDLYPCQHVCYGPFGPASCHPQGDIVPCQHTVPVHPFDVVPCSHPAHPAGDVETVCP